MTSADLLWAVRAIGERARLVGMDVVEVLPTRIGSADITALVAERIVREALTGIWRSRRGPARTRRPARSRAASGSARSRG